jgi:hypothetical protein
MKSKTKKILKKSKNIFGKIFKIAWIILGILVFIWTAYWFVRVKIFYDYSFIINAMMFAVGVASSAFYISTTLLFSLIKFLIKKFKKKK